MAALRLLLYSIIVPTVFILGRRVYRLSVNYSIARKWDVPIVILPVSWQDDFWLLGWKWFTWLKRFPSVDAWYDYTRFGWAQDHRFRPRPHENDTFALVAPSGVQLCFHDPQANNELQSKYKSWNKPDPLFALLDIFGKSVVSVNGDDWQRHRRIVNPAFQEQNNRIVWDEALVQADQLLNTWLERGHASLENVTKDFQILALHVLSAAGFGQKHVFRGGLSDVPSGHKKSFADTMLFLLDDAVMAMLFHKVQLPDSVLPLKIRNVRDAVYDFNLYMREAVAFTKGLIKGGHGARTADMATLLINANEAAKLEPSDTRALPNSKPVYLTEDDVLGNLFILNLAGHETTANALIYTIPYLANSPDVQAWVREEIERATNGSDTKDWEYEKTFPHLIRFQALMYETLRFWAPLPDTTRWPASDAESLRIGDKEFIIPKGVYVSANDSSMHCDPRWWGPDSMEWKPKRWILTDPTTQKETIVSPPHEAFVAWSVGPRVCPGKKFSQVEYIAVMSLLVHKYRLEPFVMKERGMKTKDDAAKALNDTVRASVFQLTPRIKKGKEAGVMLVKR